MGSFPLWCSATIRNLALAQFATIIVCLPLVWIVANAMPQLMVDSQLKQSFSCHTKDVQEFGTTGCSCGKEATLMTVVRCSKMVKAGLLVGPPRARTRPFHL
jgi:hypothetical protein